LAEPREMSVVGQTESVALATNSPKRRFRGGQW
jgi:hypothetical protein